MSDQHSCLHALRAWASASALLLLTGVLAGCATGHGASSGPQPVPTTTLTVESTRTVSVPVYVTTPVSGQALTEIETVTPQVRWCDDHTYYRQLCRMGLATPHPTVTVTQTVGPPSCWHAQSGEVCEDGTGRYIVKP
jgi:hypothetical protein